MINNLISRSGRIKAAITSCFILVISPIYSIAQFKGFNPAYRHINYTSDNGLPQNSITGLVFDSLDNLWIGSQGGITVFNGIRFKTKFEKDYHKRVQYLFVDRNNRIWFREHKRNLYHINIQRKEFAKFSGIHEKNIGLEDFFWEHQMRMDAVRLKKVFPYDHLPFSRIITDNKATFYYYWSGMLRTYDSAAHPILKCPQPLKLFTYKNTGIAVFRTKMHGYSYFHIKNNKINKELKFNRPKISSWNTNKFWDEAFLFSDSSRAFAYWNRSIYAINLTEDQINISLIFSELPEIRNLTHAAYCARQNIFALGTSNEGIHFIQSSPFLKPDYSEWQLKQEGINKIQNPKYSIIKIGSQAVLCENGGLLTFPNSTPSFRIAGDLKSVLLYDSDERIWYQTKNSFENKLYVADKNMNLLEQYTINHPSKMLQSLQLNSILEISKGRFLASGTLEVYELNNNSRNTKPNIVAIFPNEIQGLFRLTDTNILILSNNCIYSYNPILRKYRQLNNSQGKDWRTAFRNSQGEVLLGTYGNGLYRMYQENLISLPLDRQNFLSYVNAITEDEKGFIWISTNNGIFRIESKLILPFRQLTSPDLYYSFYDKSFGYANNEFNGGYNKSVVVLRNDFFVWSNMNGFVYLNPLSVLDGAGDSPLLFESIILQDKKIDLENDSVIEIGDSSEELKININTAYYGHPQNIYIQYKIPGLKDEWIEIENNTFKLINLPHGSFKVVVRKFAGSPANAIYSYLHLKISKPVYLQLWFIIYSILLFILLVYILVMYRTKVLIKRQNELTIIVQERTADLQKSNAELKISTKLNATLNAVIVHDINGPMKFISEVTEMLAEKWILLEDNQKHAYLKKVNESTRNLYNAVKSILNWIKLTKYTDTSKESFSLLALLQEVPILSSNHFLDYYNTELTLDVPDKIFLKTDANILKMLLNNLIENAIKFSPNGRVIIQAMEKENKVEILITDNGRGMNSELIQMLMTNDQTGKHSETSFSLGYLFIKELLPKINGTIEINSNLNQGTSVCITL